MIAFVSAVFFFECDARWLNVVGSGAGEGWPYSSVWGLLAPLLGGGLGS